MKIQIMSDLHLEFFNDLGVGFLKTIKPIADTLILAGDITYAQPQHIGILVQGIKDKWKHIIYVGGNHEYYQTSIQAGNELLFNRTKELANNIYFLNNSSVVIDGVEFYGGTGWYKERKNWMGEDSVDIDMRKYMSDFKLIKDIEPEAYHSHFWFEEHLGNCFPDVIISHHLPTEECVSPKYKGNPLNCYFVSNFDVENCGAQYWIHGHSHDKNDIMIGETRVISNPRGYIHEYKSWSDNFTIDI